VLAERGGAEVKNLVHFDALLFGLYSGMRRGEATALTFRAGVDVPSRFARSRSVGAHFGLAPRKWQSGEVDRTGRISRCGDAMMRTALYEAANALLERTTRWSWLKAWAMGVAKRRGKARAKVTIGE